MKKKIDHFECNSCKRVYLSEKDFLTNTTGWIWDGDARFHFECSCVVERLPVNFNEFSWFSPQEQSSSVNQSVLYFLLGRDSLPHCQPVTHKLQKMIQNLVPSIDLIYEVKKDPILCLDLLNIGQSLIQEMDQKGGQNEEAYLEAAIFFCGRRMLSEWILGASVKAITLNTDHYKTEIYWQECLKLGILCEKLALQFAPEISSIEAYLTGMFMYCGRLVAATIWGHKVDLIYLTVKDTRGYKKWDDLEAQDNMISSLILSQIAASVWQLPPYVLDTLHALKSIQHLNINSESKSVMSICVIAYRLLELGENLDDKLLEEHAQFLGTNPKTLRNLIKN